MRILKDILSEQDFSKLTKSKQEHYLSDTIDYMIEYPSHDCYSARYRYVIRTNYETQDRLELYHQVFALHSYVVKLVLIGKNVEFKTGIITNVEGKEKIIFMISKFYSELIIPKSLDFLELTDATEVTMRNNKESKLDIRVLKHTITNSRYLDIDSIYSIINRYRQLIIDERIIFSLDCYKTFIATMHKVLIDRYNEKLSVIPNTVANKVKHIILSEESRKKLLQCEQKAFWSANTDMRTTLELVNDHKIVAHDIYSRTDIESLHCYSEQLYSIFMLADQVYAYCFGIHRQLYLGNYCSNYNVNSKLIPNKSLGETDVHFYKECFDFVLNEYDKVLKELLKIYKKY
jgi:hypothetical protein